MAKKKKKKKEKEIEEKVLLGIVSYRLMEGREGGGEAERTLS